jgi:predicted permease
VRWFSQLVRRLAVLMRLNKLDRDLEDEMRLHRELREQKNREAGMTLDEAHYAARRRFGNEAILKEVSREMWGWNSLETFGQDVRYALRQLRRNPGFAAVAVLSLALGIGANTSIFTLINDVLLKSLPVRDPQQLISFGIADGGGVIAGLDPGPWDLFPYDFYKQIENQNEVFDGLCAFDSHRESVRVRIAGTAGGGAEQTLARLVSGNYFGVLGVDSLLGRMIDTSDATGPGHNPVAVISYRYWQRKFAGDPGAVGRSIVVNGTAFTVIGVAPAAFFGETVDADPPDIWMPLTMQPQVSLTPSLLGPHGMFWLHLIGRAKSGVTWKQRQEWVNLKLRQYLVEQQGADISADDRRTISQMYVDLVPGGRGVSHLRVEYTQPLEILMGVVVLVLLIACANLANLLLARTAAREREVSTRLALGAGRFRIVRQLLTETLLLSCLGGALGLLLAYWGTRTLIAFVMAGAEYTPLQSRPDWHVLAFSLAASLLTGLLFGLAPALRVSRISLAPGLKAGSRTVSGGGVHSGRWSLPKALVAAQVALSLLLLVGAGLFVRTLRNLKDQDFGFDRQSVLLVTIDARIAGYAPGQMSSLDQRILDAVSALPGVRSATISSFPPMISGGWTDDISPEGHAPQPNEDMSSSLNGVGPSYFETVGIPVLLGRPIGPQDTASAPKAAVINQTAADYYFPHQSPIGRHISFTDPSGEVSFAVVGVARNSKYHNPREAARRMVYPALMQVSGEDLYANCLQIRAAGDPAKVTEAVRRALVGIDSNLPILTVRTLSQQVDRFLDHEELISQLSGFFALLALVLACIGLYGVMSYNVLRRTNEIGIRMALGAQSGGVLWLVLKECLLLLAIGVAAGVPVTLAAGRLVRSQLFGLSASDPVILAVAVLSIGVVTLLAAYLPARRASRVDPVVALRFE